MRITLIVILFLLALSVQAEGCYDYIGCAYVADMEEFFESDPAPFLPYTECVPVQGYEITGEWWANKSAYPLRAIRSNEYVGDMVVKRGILSKGSKFDLLFAGWYWDYDETLKQALALSSIRIGHPSCGVWLVEK